MDAPNNYKTAGAAMMVSGLMSTVIMGLWALGFVGTCYGACLAIFPLGSMAWTLNEAYVGYRMYNGEKITSGLTSPVINIVSIVLALLSCMGVIPLVCECFALVSMNNDDVKEYLNS